MGRKQHDQLLYMRVILCIQTSLLLSFTPNLHTGKTFPSSFLPALNPSYFHRHQDMESNHLPLWVKPPNRRSLACNSIYQSYIPLDVDSNSYSLSSIRNHLPNRRSLAFKIVHFIVKLAQKIPLKNNQLLTTTNNSILVRSPSHFVPDEVDSVCDTVSFVDANNHQASSFLFSLTGKKTLASMIRGKDLESISQFGGVKNLASLLGVNIARGLSSTNTQDLLHRKAVFGSNAYKKPPQRSFISFVVVEVLKGITTVIQVLFAALSLGFGIKLQGLKQGWYDGGSNFISVFFTVLISVVIKFEHTRVSKQISNMVDNLQVIRAFRDGGSKEISIVDVVVGDIIFLKVGDQIPADGLFLDGPSLKVSHPNKSGESSDDVDEVDESKNPFLFSGTKVVDGFGRMLVTSVGENTHSDAVPNNPILGDLDDESKSLHSQLKKLTYYIIMVGLLVASLLLCVLLIRYVVRHAKDKHGNQEFSGRKNISNDVINAIIKITHPVITIIVIAIPDGPLLAVTLTVSYSLKMLSNHGILIRRNAIWEKISSVRTICIDKNGITHSQMDVSEFWIGREKVDNSSLKLEVGVFKLLREAIGLNIASGRVFQLTSECTPELSVCPIDKAVFKWGNFDEGVIVDEVNQSFEVLKVETFNSKNRRCWVMAKQQSNNTVLVYFKGAAEVILAMCSNYYDQKGILITMADEDKENFRNIIQIMGENSLTCIAFARKQEEVGDHNVMQPNESGLSLLGIVGLKCLFQLGVREALESCKEAGVDVKLITGDNTFVARAIAMEVRILSSIGKPDEELVTEGKDFRNYSNEERLNVIENIRIMASASPEDKLLMVQCLKQKGHIVAITDDGTNDTAALKEADVSLSMGTESTQVVKEISDIIVSDGQFASIVTVLSWGRCGFNNIQKVIQVQLTIVVVGFIVGFIVVISSGNAPLLWVNMVLDTLFALSLATEQPTKGDGLMKKPPMRGPDQETIVTKVIWRNIIGQTLYQVAVLLTLQFTGKSIFGVDDGVRNTLIFNCFVLSQVCNEFSSRKLKKKNIFEAILGNRLFWGIVGVTVTLQVIMVELLCTFANTTRLNGGQWAACISVAALSVPIGWLVKCIPMTASTRM